jgi:hypothetical protein
MIAPKKLRKRIYMVLLQLWVRLSDDHALDAGEVKAEKYCLYSYREALAAAMVERLRKLHFSCLPREKASAFHSA